MKKDRLNKLEKRIEYLERCPLILFGQDGVISDGKGTEYTSDDIDQFEAEGRGLLVIMRSD